MKLNFYKFSLCVKLIVFPLLLAGQGVIVSSGIHMKLTGGTLVLHGNWVNDGNYADTNSQIVLNDTNPQYIGGSSHSHFDDMIINNSKGVTGSQDFTIDGVLNLQSANASDTLGTLDMGANILTMDSSATTIGPGDVTGIVKRVLFIANTPYTFGNQFTTLNIEDGGLLPTSVSFKIVLASSDLSWKPDAIHRYYDISHTGGNSETNVSLTLHYLDSELNGTNEGSLDLFDYHVSGNLDVDDHGHSNTNSSDNWVSLSNLSLNYIAPEESFPSKYWTLGTSIVAEFTWLGNNNTDWNNTANWVGAVPSSGNHVVIPDADNTDFDPELPSNTTIGSIQIQTAGVLNGGTGTTLTIDGGTGAWENLGNFNTGTSTIVFTNTKATMSDPTNFYNVTVADGAKLTLETDNIMRIAGTLSLSNTGILNAAADNNMVEYNGTNQNVINPNGSPPGYYNLILNGSGTKTMPGSALTIRGDFSTIGTATANAGSAMAITGNFTIGSDATFNTGAYNHSIAGNFTNNNSFNSTIGNTFTFNGNLPQTIGGTSATTFYNLTSNNNKDVTVTSDALTTVSGVLTINSGKQFSIAPGKQLTAEGTITNNAGASNFFLHSGAAGTASLLHNTDNVPATVQRYISGDAEAWHFISSPVAAQGISGSWLPSGTYGNGTGYDLYLWNEPNNCWIYRLNTTSAINWNMVHPSGNFTPGRGYLYSVQANNPTKAFVGNLNNGSITYPLTTSSDDLSLRGFNFVGNPYPSSIDWQSSSGWTRSNLVSSGGGYDMWIWNPAANNYGVCNSATGICTNSVTRYISSMQGFFVQASSPGNLGMDNTLRVHENTGSWFKNTSPEIFRIVVESNTDNSYDEAGLLFGYIANEPGARKLFSNVATAPSLYMSSRDENYSVQYLTDTVDNPSVPVRFIPGQDGKYTLKCDFDVNEFSIVMLEDRQTNYIQNLKTGKTYCFNASTNDDANRFILHFGPDRYAHYNQLPARIYTSGNQVIIDLTLVSNETEVSVYDASGRLLLQNSLQGLRQHKFSINAPPQILFVYLKNQQGNFNCKLYYANKYE